jgi:hypothetical protein
LTRLAGQYAREKQEILRDLRNYRASEIPVASHFRNQTLPGIPGAAVPPPPRTPGQPTLPPKPPQSR